MTTYHEILSSASRLSLAEKARLLEDLSAVLRRELADTTPKRSLLGIWHEESLSAADIDAARQALWGNFPREDVE